MTESRVEAGSFRDRQGRVFYSGKRVFRTLNERAWKDWQRLSATRFFRDYSTRGLIIPTRESPDVEAPAELEGEWAGVLEHDRVPFLSYPYEWSFGMLQDAALLHLDLLLAALDEDMALKDASAYNVQWMGSRPVFIDTGSFEPFRKGQPWSGYRQFSQLFLFPLLLQSYRNLPFQPLLRGRVDGILPSDCNAMMSMRDLLRSGVFSHVYLQSKLEQRYGNATTDVRREMHSAGFSKALITANLKKLHKLVSRLQWQPSRSTWSEYTRENTYSDAETERKRRFIQEVADIRRRPLVWDLGCNTGEYSRLAAARSDYVVSIDSDQLAIERLYRQLKQEGNEKILPLVNELADYSPDLGWRGAERRGLTSRDRPQLILALALIHHMVISANIPLAEFVAWLAATGEELVLEFVDKSDPMVETLLRNKDDQYADYEADFLETNLRQFYRIERREKLESGSRTLYHCVPR